MILPQVTPSTQSAHPPKVVEAEPVTKCTQCNKVKPAKEMFSDGICHSCYLADLPF